MVEKREKLAQHAVDSYDEETIFQTAMEGCIGLNYQSDEEINQQYKDIFGDEENDDEDAEEDDFTED